MSLRSDYCWKFVFFFFWFWNCLLNFIVAQLISFERNVPIIFSVFKGQSKWVSSVYICNEEYTNCRASFYSSEFITCCWCIWSRVNRFLLQKQTFMPAAVWKMIRFQLHTYGSLHFLFCCIYYQKIRLLRWYFVPHLQPRWSTLKTMLIDGFNNRW